LFELIRSHDGRYDEYEKLLLERDKYRKDAERYLRIYIHEFGELTAEVFKLKISCIEKKKTISFCQMYANRGEPVDMDKLDQYISNEMARYYETLKEMAENNELCRQLKTIPQAEVLEIKSIYRKIAKCLHPDLNPLTEDSEELSDLWNRVSLAYNCNDLKELRELEVLVNKVLNEYGDGIEINIPDIDGKIQQLKDEIDKILSTDPYMYKHLLESKDLIAEKKDELNSELEEYRKYEDQLKEILKGFVKNGVRLTWETEN